MDRYKIRNIGLIDVFIKSIVSNFGKYVSLSRLETYFKGLGIKVSKKTLSNYMRYLEDAFFIFTTDKLSPKVRVRVQQPRKVYSIDTGFYNLSRRFSEESGVRIENLVAINLFREALMNPLIEIYYWRDYVGHEVDFVVREGLNFKQLIQVTYASAMDEVERREINSLTKASNELNCSELLVVTWDYEGFSLHRP